LIVGNPKHKQDLALLLIKKYVRKGNKFSSNLDAANTALIELFYRIEMLEKVDSREEREG
jgi:hypothetical protein